MPVLPDARPAWASAKMLARRAAVIGLALHAATILYGADAEPTTARAFVLMAAALAVGLCWSRVRPVVVPRARRWDRATVEAIAVGPAAALFALLLGWAAATGIPT